ncbi:MAG: hypothetical protein ACI3ZK_01200 [Candidatus Cryptobacteroides sp.]
MNNQDYKKNLDRLKEIEEIVKNPDSSLDSIDALLEETKKIVEECFAYTRNLKEKVEGLADLPQQ